LSRVRIFVAIVKNYCDLTTAISPLLLYWLQFYFFPMEIQKTGRMGRSPVSNAIWLALTFKTRGHGCWSLGEKNPVRNSTPGTPSEPACFGQSFAGPADLENLYLTISVALIIFCIVMNFCTHIMGK